MAHPWQAVYNRAFALEKLGRPLEALKDYTRAAHIQPGKRSRGCCCW